MYEEKEALRTRYENLIIRTVLFKGIHCESLQWSWFNTRLLYRLMLERPAIPNRMMFDFVRLLIIDLRVPANHWMSKDMDEQQWRKCKPVLEFFISLLPSLQTVSECLFIYIIWDGKVVFLLYCSCHHWLFSVLDMCHWNKKPKIAERIRRLEKLD